MDNKTRMRGNDQLSTRIGAEFLHNFNTYLTKNNVRKTQFIRDALEYWMSVNGKPEFLSQQIHEFERENQHLKELLAEKERTIQILQGQIERIDGTRPSPLINVNGNRNVTAVNKNTDE